MAGRPTRTSTIPAKKELRPAKDQLGDAPVPPRGPGAREGAGAGPLQDFLLDEH